MPAKKLTTIEELDAEIMRISNEKDALNERSRELHRQRDALLQSDRFADIVNNLSDDDKAALRERLAE